MKETVKISLVTTCKGRLSYLKESILTWLDLDYPDYDIVVVDYGCPDRTAHYFNANKTGLLSGKKARDIKVAAVTDKPLFNLNDARNIGIRHSDSELILMIDSDIHIRDKNILSKILRDYRAGVVFFSNHQILNSNYFEAHRFYQFEFKQELDVPTVVPCGSHTSDLSGTACFQKKIFQQCGEFKPEISEAGFGWDEVEFYLRYLNFYFYRVFHVFNAYGGTKKSKNISIGESLDRVLFHFKTFDEKVFSGIVNPDEEKDRFYSTSLQNTRERNKEFIRLFFKHYLHSLTGTRRFPVEPGKKPKTLFRYGRDKKVPVSNWYRVLFPVWYGRELFHLNRLEESKKYLRKAAAMEGISSKFVYGAYFFLGEIAAVTGDRKYRRYYDRCLTILLNKKNKSLSEKYNIGVLLFKMKEYDRCERWFKKMLRLTSLPSGVLSGIYLFIGDIRKMKKDERWKDYYLKGIEVLVKKRHKSNYDKYRIASFYKRLNRFEEAKEWFRELLDTEKDKKTRMGVYFHLAEIHGLEGDARTSQTFARKCLEINPHHGKAKELLAHHQDSRSRT